MKKKLMTAVCAAAISFSMCIPAFAGQWLMNANGWWWQNDDGSWPVSTWQWIDGNNDGISECYYFDENGYLLTNTFTPDGHTVNADGAWIEYGFVQTQGTAFYPETPNQGIVQNDADTFFTDIYAGVYHGESIQAEIGGRGGDLWTVLNSLPVGEPTEALWVEVDGLYKGGMPNYLGNGVFDGYGYHFELTGTSFIYQDLDDGTTIHFLKQ